MGRLAAKNILITGGNSGIGLAAAQEFDREGARVAVCGLNEVEGADSERCRSGLVTARSDSRTTWFSDRPSVFGQSVHPVDGAAVRSSGGGHQEGDGLLAAV